MQSTDLIKIVLWVSRIGEKKQIDELPEIHWVFGCERHAAYLHAAMRVYPSVGPIF